MKAPLPPEVLKQHLIDPEICIRCNTCEETCPIDVITHDGTNYVVDPDICNGCMACVAPCPTGSIDNWRLVLKAEAYSVQDQFGWDELPGEKPLPADSATDPASNEPAMPDVAAQAESVAAALSLPGASMPPWSAAHPYVNLYTHQAPATATVVGNYCVTAVDPDTNKTGN